MITSRLLLLFVLSFGSAGVEVAAQVEPPVPQLVGEAADEFPRGDELVWDLYRRGLVAKLARAELAKAPDSLEALTLLMEAERLDDAIGVLNRLVERRPASLAFAFDLLMYEYGHRLVRQGGSRYAAVRALVPKARAHIPNLDREDAARLARALLWWSVEPGAGSREKVEALETQLVADYAGTETALRIQVDRLASTMLASKYGTPLNTEPLDTFVREHTGTTAGAYALYQQGVHLAHNSGERPGTDPFDRLMRVVAIVSELESGRYPASEWVEKAPSLISGFFPYEPKYSTESIDRSLEAYERFVRTHYLPRGKPENSVIADVVMTKIPQLVALQGGGLEDVERRLARLEENPSLRAPVRYLRGQIYINRLRDRSDARERRVLYQKARDVFESVYAGSSGLIRRRALATRAALELGERDCRSARESYRRYLEEFTGTAWSWVAALRIGQCEAYLGDWKRADAAYKTALARYHGTAPALVLGLTYDGRSHEALGDFSSALAAYRQAFAAWDPDYGQAYSLFIRDRPKPGELGRGEYDDDEVRKDRLNQRISELARTLKDPGGALLEEGRWFLSRDQHRAALSRLDRFIARYPSSPAMAEARDLEGRARLDRALEIADVENAKRDEATALKELELLSAHPSAFAAFAAQIARAAILWKRGASAEAEQEGKRAFVGWVDRQRLVKPTTDAPALQSDVAAIRNLLFHPREDPFIGTGWERWRGLPSPGPFVILRRHITVRLSNGEIIDVDAIGAPAVGNAAFFTEDQISFFANLLAKLGGTGRRQPAIMEVPNQSASGSVDLQAFLRQIFPMRPGHWSRRPFETFPIIRSIDFGDAARTKAAVHLTTGNEGVTALIEKVDSRWVGRQLVDHWIE